MPLDARDRAEIAKMVHGSVKVLGGKLEASLLGALKVQAPEGAPDLQKRLAELEEQAEIASKEKAALQREVHRERERAEIVSACAAADLVPELGIAHFAALREENRIIHEKDGTIRVRDKGTTPTIAEYAQALAHSELGPIYQPYRQAGGAGGRAPAAPTPPPGPIHGAVSMLITGQKP